MVQTEYVVMIGSFFVKVFEYDKTIHEESDEYEVHEIVLDPDFDSAIQYTLHDASEVMRAINAYGVEIGAQIQTFKVNVELNTVAHQDQVLSRGGDL